jgi:eukaryotic-like serine/threonine-protein kinase
VSDSGPLPPWVTDVRCAAPSAATVVAAPSPAPPPGSPVAAAGALVVPGYEVEGELGHGGMGVVYKARHVKLNRPVALKVVRTGAQANPEALARFRTEAEAVARLQHPNIVQIYEVGEHQGPPYFSLEFVDGGSLAEKLAGAPQPYGEAARLLEVLARAVHYAHERGVVHRDLKPANVLLTADGTPKIADFGLAKRLDGEGGQTRSGVVMGTLQYMAPEQAAGKTKEVGRAADVYALGAILYEMLTGRPPFLAATCEAALKLVLFEEPAPPRRLRPHLPRDLQTICLKCLAKAPRARYANALELADDLRCYLDGRPIRVRPVGPVGRLWRWSRRNPLRPLSCGLALALLAAAVGLLIYRNAAAWGKAIEAVEAHWREADETLQTQRREVTDALDRGLALCRQGETGEGMLWLARGLERVPPGASDLERVLRGNLAGWGGRLSPLTGIWSHPSEVWAVAFSSDGKTAVTGCADGATRLWEVATGQKRGTLTGHQGPVRAVAFSPDGKTVLTGSEDGTARLWNAATGEKIGQPLRHDDLVCAVAFSPDGRTVLTGSWDNTARLWQANTGKFITRLSHEKRVFAVAFHPDGKKVLTGSEDKTARVWDAATGAFLPKMTFSHPQEGVYAVAFSPDDGRTVLTAGREVARLRNVATGEWHDLRHQGLLSTAFSPDGRTVLTGSEDKTARLWEVASGRHVGDPLQHPSKVQGVAFGPEGKSVLTGCGDGKARLWTVAPARSMGRPLPHGGNRVNIVAFNPKGGTVLTGGHGPEVKAKVWDAVTGGLSRSLEHGPWVKAAAWAPDGKLVLTGGFDKTAWLWDAATGQRLEPPLRHDGWVEAVAFSPDGRTALTGSADGSARLWHTASGQPAVPPLRHERTVFAVAFSPDGKTVLTGSEDGTARLWNAATGEKIGQPLRHDEAVFAVAFSPDGATVLTGSRDKTARLWDAVTGRVRGQPLQHQGAVYAVTFSPDGQTALTGSADKYVRLWDARTGKLLRDDLRHDGAVRQVAFSPDGQLVLTGGEDQTARLWDRVTGQPFGPPWRHPGKVWRAAFSPDGRTVAAGSNSVGSGAAAWLWDVPAPAEGAAERVALWAQVITGWELDKAGIARGLDAETWRHRRRTLEEMGGSPLP